MACLLIVDDDPDNARQLAEIISAGVPGSHEVVCIQRLADLRRFHRLHKPDLILVELLSHQSNGFTLASALARKSQAPVVLVTDRELVSDRLWGSARGIEHVMSRRGGRTALLQQIRNLLHVGSAQQDTGAADELHEAAQLSRSLVDELRTAPVAALLACVSEEVRQLPCKTPVSRLGAVRPGTAQLPWLKNLLFYISDAEVCDAVQTLIRQPELPEQPQKESDSDAWLQARERVLLLLELDAGATVKVLCKEYWSEVSQLLQNEYAANFVAGGTLAVGSGGAGISALLPSSSLQSSSSFQRCKHLLNAMTFVPGFDLCTLTDTCDNNLSVLAFIEAVQRLLNPADARQELRNLIHTECVRAMSRADWRPLAGLGLMLRAVDARRQWQTVLNCCLPKLYGWKNHQTAEAEQQLISLSLSLLNNIPCEPQLQDLPDDCLLDLGLPAESVQRLMRSLSQMSAVLDREMPLHQRLSLLMVSVYKLRSWLEFSMAGTEIISKFHERWRLLIGCVYQIVCHGVLQPNTLMHVDINDLKKSVRELQHCLHQELLPSENTLLNLAALEMTIANRSQPGSRQDHRLLAAGLHRLPKPDCIMSDLLTDVQQSGTVLSEISHELRVLTEGAHRLGVVRVESLARLILDCYEQLRTNPDLLQGKNLRLALVRAHRVLCRLLDQAAAWLPLDQTGSGLSVSAVIDDLFMQFNHSENSAYHSKNGPEHAAWMQCQSLNRHLRQLIKRADNLSEYRSLIVELLREQQAVITPHLPYQSPD